MPRLTAAQLLELDILSNEQSGDDRGDDSEFDMKLIFKMKMVKVRKKEQTMM